MFIKKNIYEYVYSINSKCLNSFTHLTNRKSLNFYIFKDSQFFLFEKSLKTKIFITVQKYKFKRLLTKIQA